MAEENGTTSTSVETPVGKFAFSGKRTAEFITVILAIGVSVMSYVVWTHARSSENHQVAIETSMNKMAGAQRFFACVIATPQEDRMKQLEQDNSFCNRMARQ